jgi:hypothetical protein
MEVRGRRALLQLQPAALRALAQRTCIGFLQRVEAMAARPALVLENWHA